jgi:hypothetical protein
LIGDIGSVSEPLTKNLIEQNQKKIYLQLFYLNIPTENTSFVHGFVFSPSQCVSIVRQAFHSANLALKHIPKYKSNHFFSVPQFEDSSNHISLDNFLSSPRLQDKTYGSSTACSQLHPNLSQYHMKYGITLTISG